MNVNECFAHQNMGLPEDILRRKLHGDFAGAIRLIDRRMQEPSTTHAMRCCLEVHREILRRLPGEFPYTRDQALAIIREHVPDFTEEEFDEYVDARHIRWIYVKGEERYFDRFYSSLVKAAPGFAQRAGMRQPGVESEVSTDPVPGLLDISMQKMKETGSMTNRIRVRATLKLKDEHFVPGMFLRAHLPIPAACQQQKDIRIEKIWPEGGVAAPEDAPNRTVCWEKTLEENMEFGVEYSYLHTAVFTDAYNLSAEPFDADFDIGEQTPHIVFTPYIRALCQELTAGLTDPMAKARSFYDYITKNMHYTYMPDYFVLDNIADTCARELSGDCGVFALLFITLCRCAGIPAQWQSGLTTEPDFIGSHDWARFYIEPYGWLFADPSYGTGAVRQGKEERRQFYFGNLDPYRMVANSAFGPNYTIPKQHWAADPCDNQSGELETTHRGFTYDEYERDKEILLCQEA